MCCSQFIVIVENQLARVHEQRIVSNNSILFNAFSNTLLYRKNYAKFDAKKSFVVTALACFIFNKEC